MVARDRSEPEIEAADADAQEQERSPVEGSFDPEQTAGGDLPDETSVRVDPADAQEQLLEVTEEDE